MIRKFACLAMAVLVLALLTPLDSSAETRLSWDSVSGNVTGYRIWYGKAKDSHTSSKELGNVTEYSLNNLPLEEDVKYYFVVRAYNSGGESGDSNEVSWTAEDLTPPLPPEVVK